MQRDEMTWSNIVERHSEILMFVTATGERVPMTPGIRSGWYGLINELCLRLEQTPKPWPACTDLKVSRGGELCFYVDSASDEQYGLIEMAEELSLSLCDTCGEMKVPEKACCN